MADLFIVQTCKGPSWDPLRPRREQAGWEAHAAFMDALVEEGLIVMGGPLGDLDADEALLVVEAASEEEARQRLSQDPWIGGVLSLRSLRPWTLWLRRRT